MKLQTPGQKCLMSPRSFLCFVFFISSSSPFFSNQMHHTGMCAYMYTEQLLVKKYQNTSFVKAVSSLH